MNVHSSLNVEFASMASSITIKVTDPQPQAHSRVRAAQAIFESIAATCTRFDEDSALMQLNASPDQWNTAPQLLIDVIKEAHAAYVRTQGRFDPRILHDLTRHGYEKSRQFSDKPELQGIAHSEPMINRTPWEPEFSGQRVLVGADPIDLGGIAKGLAVRWAKDLVMDTGVGFLINAGGDIASAGVSAQDKPWTVGLENPWDFSGEPIVVVKGVNALATSSIRLRSWKQNGKSVHHLIDPRTGAPGGAGLVSVSVIDTDTAAAEVWTKSLFLEGSAGIGDLAERFNVAAIWVTTDANVEISPAARDFAIWSVNRAHRK